MYERPYIKDRRATKVHTGNPRASSGGENHDGKSIAAETFVTLMYMNLRMPCRRLTRHG